MLQNTEELDNCLEEELELLLADFTESESEAELARQYVRDTNGPRDRLSEQVAGIPGAGLVVLVGPLLLTFIAAVAHKALEDVQSQLAKSVVSTVVSLKRRFVRGSAPLVGTREEALSSITAALIKAGWSAAAAGRAADRAWVSGQRVAKRVGAPEALH
jgi:hypothetical protein